MELCGS